MAQLKVERISVFFKSKAP